MAALKTSELNSFIKRKGGSTRAALLYGPDIGAVREYGKKLIAGLLDGEENSLSVHELSDDTFKNDPGALSDAAGAISMLGGRTIVVIRDAGAGLAAVLPNSLAITTGDGFIVAMAGALKGTDKLVKLFKAGDETVVIPCYEDNAGSLFDLVQEITTKAGLSIERNALSTLVYNLGSDRSLSRGEIEKLCLYCYGSETITLADVQAIIGDVSAVTTDNVIDHALSGNEGEAIHCFQRMLASGNDVSGLLSMLSNHLYRLQQFRIDFDNGKPATMLLKQARPPVFFRRHNLMGKAIELWSDKKLDRAIAGVADAIRNTRTTPDIRDIIAERTILTLARLARSR